MSDFLFHRATHYLDATPSAVYAAILQGELPSDVMNLRSTADITQRGALIEVRALTGTVGTIGRQVVARHNFGPLDIETIETLIAVTPGQRIVIEQCPDRFVVFDRNERMMGADDRIPDDIAGLFAQTYGDPPTATQMTFDLAPQANGTEILLTIEAKNRPRRGWWGKRQWEKAVAAEARAIVLNVWGRLQVQ